MSCAALAAAPGIARDQDRPTPLARCARCASNPADIATRDVVSDKFTAYAGWADPAGRWLCPGCAWGYRTKRLRSQAFLVRRDPPAMCWQTTAQVATLLQQPLPGGIAVVVPLRPGRAHLIDQAHWGAVTSDAGTVPWTAGDAARLRHMLRLRACGFGSRMLREPAPPFTVLHRQPADQWPQITAAWAALSVWRERPPWLRLAVAVTASAHGTTLEAA